MNKKTPIILASESIRRIEILKALKLSFTAAASHIDEIRAEMNTDPLRLVEMNAGLKAASTSLKQKYPEAFILGVDTLVSCNGKIFEKPNTHQEAREMLSAYLTYPAQVHTGMALYQSASKTLRTEVDTTVLTARKDILTQEEDVEQFFQHIVSLDKSGGFSIEGIGAILFDQIEGSFYTVVGMPLHLMFKLFKEAGIDIYTYLTKS